MLVQNQLSLISGEFRDEAAERAFQSARFRESARQARLLFSLSAILNTLFLASDWRFYGDPHFYVAIPARGVVIAIAVIAYVGARRCRRFRELQAWMVSWEWVNAIAVGVLVTSQSEIALFVVIMLPSIYYLAVPTRFRWTALTGIGSSIVLLLGYVLPGPHASLGLGLFLAMLMLNVALVLVVTKSNRLRRLEWSAIRSERFARQRLAASQKMLETVFAAIPIPMVVGALSDGRVLRVNDAARSYFHGDAEGSAVDNIGEIEMDAAGRALFRRVLARDHRVSGLEASLSMADGTRRDVLLSAATVDTGGVASVVISGIDITARKSVEARLERLATTDSLTGVANRSHFFSRADAEIKRSARHRSPLSVLMIDLDHFKRINDEYGHAVGDGALMEFAAQCSRTLRESDILARYGGEEFVALLVDTDALGAASVAERLREATAAVELPGVSPARRLSVSIGISTVLQGENEIDPALRRADEALYHAKATGRDKIVAWTRELGAQTACSSSNGQAA